MDVSISSKVLNKISSIHRFNGTYLFQPETLPDHCTEMALLCINFSKLVDESDVKDMCYRCMVHDLEESISSDVPRTLKHQSEELKELVDKTAYELLAKECSEEILNDVKNAKNKTNVNGFLVHIADRIQCFMKMSREVENYGNRVLKSDFEFFKSCIHELFSEIKQSETMSEASKKNLIEYIQKIIISN